MNGRIYDPVLGRFMTADPVIQEPFSTQNLNRYAYVLNNPLAYTDPNGYFFKSIFRAISNFISSIVSNPRMIIAVAAAIIVPQVAGAMMMEAAASAAYATANVVGNGFVVANTAFATAVVEVGAASTLTGVSASLTTVGAMTAAAAGGFTAGVITGGSLESGLKGAIAGAAAVAIGSALSSTELAGFAKGIPARMIGSGVNGALQTGDARGFLRGFLAGALPNDLGFTQAYKNDPWANVGINIIRDGARGAIVAGDNDGIVKGIAIGQVTNAFGHAWGAASSNFAPPKFRDGVFYYPDSNRFGGKFGYNAITFGNVVMGPKELYEGQLDTLGMQWLDRHERGHGLQAEWMGALYLPLHAISQWTRTRFLEYGPLHPLGIETRPPE